MSGATTLPALLRENARRCPARPALREKKLGIWQTYTWADSFAETRDMAFGLAALGFEPGDRLCVMGDNRPGLYCVQLAAQALGGIAVPLEPNRPTVDLAYSLARVGARWIVVEGEEQLDRLLAVEVRGAQLRYVIALDARTSGDCGDAQFCTFNDIKDLGRELAMQDPELIDRMIDGLNGETIALLSNASSQLSANGDVLLSHNALIAAASGFSAAVPVHSTDEWLAYLPMAWTSDSLFSVALALMHGFACNCPEGPETILQDLVEIGPHGFFAPQQVWEALRRSMESRSARSSQSSRRVFQFFLRCALDAVRLREAGLSPSARLKVCLFLGEHIFYGAVRDKLGFGRCRWAYTAGTALAVDTLRFFRAIGIDVKQLENITELTNIGVLRLGLVAADGAPELSIAVEQYASIEIEVKNRSISTE